MSWEGADPAASFGEEFLWNVGADADLSSSSASASAAANPSAAEVGNVGARPNAAARSGVGGTAAAVAPQQGQQQQQAAFLASLYAEYGVAPPSSGGGMQGQGQQGQLVQQR